MNGIGIRSISYPAMPPTHLGTSDTHPHAYEELLVQPSSLTPRVTDPLIPVRKGGAFYAKLYEVSISAASSLASAPRYYGVAFRFGITDISTVNIFFHPSPGYAGMKDSEYIGLTGTWRSLYRYIQQFGVQLAAGSSNMVLAMPIFSDASWSTLGSFHARWQEILNGILVEVQKVAWPDKPGETMPRNQAAMTDVILSGFSAGLIPLTHFRSAPRVRDVLREIWDFDGAGTLPPHAPASGQALLYNQNSGPFHHNVFHVPRPRWKLFPFFLHGTSVHGEVPMRLFYHAETLSRYGH